MNILKNFWSLCKNYFSKPNASINSGSNDIIITAFDENIVNRIPSTIANETHHVRQWENRVKTGRYTWWNFLPLNLFQQALISSNMYFILMAFFQLLPAISDSGGIPTFIFPLSFVFIITMIKDGYEDFNRHLSDREENDRECFVLKGDGKFHSMKWHLLRPGDIVKVLSNQMFPADLILLNTSDFYGISYVETVQLDGETNLKDKSCFNELQELFSETESLVKAKIQLTCSPPDALIYTFKGFLNVYGKNFKDAQNEHHENIAEQNVSPSNDGNQSDYQSKSELSQIVSFTRKEVNQPSKTTFHAFEGIPYVKFSLNINNFLWRGTSLKNTDWIIGIVVYTGHRTKISRNSRPRDLKFSKLQETYNNNAIFLACCQFVLCLIAAIVYSLSSFESEHHNKYVSLFNNVIDQEVTRKWSTFFYNLGTCFGRYCLLLSYFIPITLLVQLELVKWSQAYFLQHDDQMNSQLAKKKASVQTVNLVEELGNVTHIFSDKTGTLTLNLMKFKSLGITGFYYYKSTKTAPKTQSKETEAKSSKDNKTVDEPENAKLIAYRRCPNQFVDFDAWDFLLQLNGKDKEIMDYAKYFFLILAICHSAIPKSKIKQSKINDESSDCYCNLNPELDKTSVNNDSKVLKPKYSSIKHVNIANSEEPQVTFKSSHATIKNGYYHEDSSISNKFSNSILTNGTKTPLYHAPSDMQSFCKGSLTSQELVNQLESKSLSSEDKLINRYHNTVITSIPYRENSTVSCDVSGNDIQLQTTSTTNVPKNEPQLNPDSVSLWYSDPAYETTYDASSPDELALVNGVRHIGLEFVERPTLNSIKIALTNSKIQNLLLDDNQLQLANQKLGTITKKKPFLDNFPSYDANFDWLSYYKAIQENPSLIKSGYVPCLSYEILEVLEFDSTRKKMSVVVRDGYNSLKIFTKGADSSMLSDQKNNYASSDIENQVSEISRQGLRTLVFGYRNITENEFSVFREKVLRTRLSYDENDTINAYNEFEKNLTIVGCTGIEDKLQPKVPETIQELRMANIKLWILTGDKLETALSISHSCNVLTSSTYNTIIQETTEADIRARLHKFMTFIVAGQLANDAINELLLLQLKKKKEPVKKTSKKTPKYCCYPFEKLKNKSKQTSESSNKQKVTLSWSTFRLIIFKYFKLKPVISEPLQKHAEPLTISQANSLIQVYLTTHEKEKTQNSIDATNPINLKKTSPRISKYPSVQRYTHIAITITGDALAVIFENEEIKKYFLGLANLSSTIIACRVSPKQKAEIVNEYRKNQKKSVILAIGDGANDCGMIIAADVGVGICGKEGTQAVRAADFAIGEFSLLKNLLFHHGHENLRRNSIHIYHTIFKNVLIAALDWLFGFYSSFSAPEFYHPWLKQIYNSFYNSLPPVFYSIFDRMLPTYILINCPSLYPVALSTKISDKPNEFGRSENYYFGNLKFILCFFYGFLTAVVCVFVMGYVTGVSSLIFTGSSSIDIHTFGQVNFYIVVIISNISLIPFIYSWYWFLLAAFAMCIIIFFVTWSLYSGQSDLYNTLSTSLAFTENSITLHLSMIYILILTMLPLVTYQYYKAFFNPDFIRIIRERIALGVFDVVIAPKQMGGLAVVVPRPNTENNWHGFAFSESRPRLQLQRRQAGIPGSVYTQTVKLRVAAEDLFVGNVLTH